MRPTIMEVNLKTFMENIDVIQKYVGNKKIMPVIKANAYGTYINKDINILNYFDIVAVATCDEAVNIRKIGYNKDIFVLNQPFQSDLEIICKYNLTIGVSDYSFIELMIHSNREYKIHLEIETGMNRTGIDISNLNSIITLLKGSNKILIEGVYTHLSSADYDYDYTINQYNIFKNAIEIIKYNFDSIKYVHVSATNGMIRFKDFDNISNLVRPGIAIYGYESFKNMYEYLNVKPVALLKTKIIFLKTVKMGESIGYSRKYITNSSRIIATIPIGYADGLRRNLSNIGSVIINGKKAPIVGNICMDSCMIDVTDIEDISIGTDVYIWDNEYIKLEEIAEKCNTINYEILCTISDRVTRKFI